jgi:diguanylate cyclase (GGDEF)-like protein
MKSSTNAELYIQEIEVWKKASKIHADRAIEQYKNVVHNIEQFTYEKQRNETILDHISDIIIVLDTQNNILLFNRTARVYMNLKTQDVDKKNIYDVLETIFPDLLGYIQYKNIENTIVHFKEKYFSLNIHNENILEKRYSIIVMNNITEIIKLQKSLAYEKTSLEDKIIQRTKDLRKEVSQKEKAHRKLKKLVLTDFLTKLPNRQAFYQELERVMQYNEQLQHYSFAVLFIDLDGFKSVNDSLGHEIGDKLLIEISKILKKSIRNDDFVARLAGDEFVVLVDAVTSQSHVENIAQKLVKSFQKQIDIEKKHSLTVTVSIGILMNPDISSSISEILSMADRAMYEVKNSGKNSFRFFNNDMLVLLKKEVNIVQKVEEGLSNNEFYLHYQPICNLDGIPVSCEVLSRWKHKGTAISPFEFIPILENRGMIAKFTYKIIDDVFEILSKMDNISCVSINLSVYQFYEENLVEFLSEKCKKFPNNSHQISFEITESIFTKDPEMIFAKLQAIKEMGYKIYIDDFGTGYSSFEYIRKYPVDVLKIDKVFVDEIVNDLKQYKLLQGMVALAKSLDIDVIIEGVETSEQFELIKKIDKNIKIQGYYFYKPLELSHLEKLIMKHSL